MVLESQSCKAELHRLSQNKIQDLTTSMKNSYSQHVAGESRNEPVIPSPAIFDFDQDAASTLSRERGDPQRLPIAAACATHLELLGVFYRIRQEVLGSEAIDKGFGIVPKREEKTGFKGDKKTLKDPTLWDRRQVKWPSYMEHAALRFLAWRKCLQKLEGTMIVKEGGNYSLAHLPPLDIIMVWHSFMLNPRFFYETCKGELLYQIRMPWKSIHDHIDNRSWAFKLTSEEAASFTSNVELPSDLFEDFSQWQFRSAPPLSEFSLARECPTGGNIWQSLVRMGDESIGDANLFVSENKELAITLRDAVERQCSFVDKMNAHLWIRSPALEGTLRRAIDRYSKFLNIMRLNKDTMIVPTLDIDLVWHTHQCTALFYGRGMHTIVGRFINHDDSIVQEKLGTGFEITQKQWKIRYGKQYRVCGCWDCEALLSAMEDVARCDMTKVDMASIAAEVQNEVTYYRVVEVAIREKKPLPRTH